MNPPIVYGICSYNDIISGDYNDVNNNIDFNENVILISIMLSPMNDRPHHAFTDLSLDLSVDNVSRGLKDFS